MDKCKCGSYAINHHLYGRDGSEPELCDVCFWRAKSEALQRDAQRYRWLRSQHWSKNTLSVVMNPKEAVQLGRFCPSGDLLDQALDEAMLGCSINPASSRMCEQDTKGCDVRHSRIENDA